MLLCIIVCPKKINNLLGLNVFSFSKSTLLDSKVFCLPLRQGLKVLEGKYSDAFFVFDTEIDSDAGGICRYPKLMPYPFDCLTDLVSFQNKTKYWLGAIV